MSSATVIDRPVAVVHLIGNPRTPSRTGTLAGAVNAALTKELLSLGVVTAPSRVVDLARLVSVSFGAPDAGPAGVGGGPNHADSAATSEFDAVRGAGLLIVATPTYKGTFTGLLKVFLDALPADGLAGVTAVAVAVAASPAHRSTVGAALNQLLLELGATVPGPPLVLLESELALAPEMAAGWAADNAQSIAPFLAGPELSATREAAAR